ncbi:unnamed protein product [Trifolium pratense]|uniref:Uncharacterized protein n=1 Tax=Trifolium pratense TaxID=57577 RepID=A0ACB0M1N5_TRIPR|nr:unnamed protein product [Trifolium pratense]
MPHSSKVRLVGMFEAVQEIAIYIHRFHNLDLFSQGWYQIKVTMRWEDSENISFGIPARVVQYEDPDLGPGSLHGIWRIDDTDNSFSTQPFRIKYARQDVHLCMMVSFNLSLSRYQGLPTTAVILKFELMYAPPVENGTDLQDALDPYPASVHEFRIPPKALLGLHSYCPVHFDALHAALVDVSVHVSLLSAPPYPSALKVPSNSHNSEVVVDKSYDTLNHGLEEVASVDLENVMLLKTLLMARDILLEELQKLSKAVNQTIEISEFQSKLNNDKILKFVVQANRFATDVEILAQGNPQNGLKRGNDALDLLIAEKLRSLSKSELLDCCHSVGDQLLYLWNTFLKFHRDNKTKILEFLRDAWAMDRKTEWSIWMVYSKVEMPHHYINSWNDEFSYRGVHRRVSSLLKSSDEPLQTAATRAEVHRKSIAQMRINNQSIQDMQMFGDPLRIPIVIVERVMNAPRRTISENSYLRNVILPNSHNFQDGLNSVSDTANKESNPQSNARVLKIVVFVHGFQGHHLDLRLIRNQWLLIDPKVEVLMSQANEDKTSGDFREMGQRLSQEVISFVKKKMDKASKYGNLGDIRLSFVGHSIGNLIIRTAIAESTMEPFLRYLHTYVSLSGPHLGYLYSSNSLFNSGLWLFKKLKGTQCIHQLTFTDDPDIQNTFLYKLCKKTLDNFRHIILLSSPQDGYVPYHSARIESCQAASRDNSKKSRVFLEMLNDCLDQIRANPSERRVFMRCDVNFDATAYGKNLDSLIGRAAHIEFLESDIFARFIMWSFPELFR